MRSRQLRFEHQLPDTLTLLASSLRAGFSLMQGLEAVAQEISDPMQKELQRVFTEVRLGRPVEDALGDAADRMDSNDLRWTVMAIRIQREVGGNLAVLLDTVSDTMVKRERIRRELRALTAEGRLSAIVLSLVSPVLALAIWLIQPDYLKPLFHDFLGIIGLIVAIVLCRSSVGSGCVASSTSRSEMIALIVLLAVAAVAAGAWAASTTVESRSGSRRSMSAMDHYEIADVRDEKMQESIGTRVRARVARHSSISLAASRRSATTRTSSARSCSPGALPATRSTAS